MDRVNRSLLVASTLLAVPAALLMASLTTGTSPEPRPDVEQQSDVQLAVGEDGDDVGGVQQVVGKQIKSRQTRPGLLQVISGSKSQGSRNHHHHNMPEETPKGLLDGFFDGSKRSTTSSRSRSSRPTTASPLRSSSRSVSNSQQKIDWDGIPYHHVHGGTTRTSIAPIRDPNATAASSSSATRIIRGGSDRRIPAKTASVRRSSEPTLAREPAQPLPAPDPVSKLTPISSSAKSFSTRSSSRRSDRRNVDALDPSEIAAAGRAPAPSVPETKSSEIDLIPKVVRKEKEQQPEPKTAEEPAPAEVAEAKTTTAQQQQEAEVPAAAAQPEQKTALADIGSPVPTSQEPPSAADVSEAALSNEVSPPAAAQQPPYSTPYNPATSPIPVAGIPTHPYAASTPPANNAIPAATASHRAGPPDAAFGNGEIANTPALPNYAVSGTYGQPQYNAASAPVGSGVVPNGDVASYRRPSQPAYNTAQRPSYPNFDPYAHQPYGPGPMMTYGQPIAGRTAPTPGTTNTQPAHETAAVPMQPIAGYAPQGVPANQAADNFAASTYESRNQMRESSVAGGLDPAQDAATSELPGIRVVTHGPSSIMIRQTCQYEIRVENRGSIDAEGVLVRALVPDWAEIRGQNATRGDVDNQVQGSTERLVWTIDHLPAGASEQMFVRLTAARSGTYDLDVDWTLVPQKSVAKVQVHEPRLDLTIEGPEEVVYGQSQTYKVRVLNPGDGTAPNVVFTLSPNSATPQTQRIGDIPPGKEAQFDVELTAQDLGDLKIHGLASGDLELRAESAKTIRVAAAELEAVLTGPELKYQNTDAMYSLQIQNNGSATSQKIIATLRLPGGVKYLGGIDEAAVQGNALKWEITSLAPGATRNYQFRCNMASTGEHLFAFDCRGTAAGNTDVSLATRVESIADLVLSVSDPTAPAPIGSEVTYEIVIHNRGSKEATDVRAIAQFSHGIEPQRIEGQSGEVVTGQVLFDSIPRIGAGQEVRMRVIAQADRAGHHRFRTEVRSGDTVLVAEEATHYMSPQSDRVSRRSSDSANR